MISLTFSVMAAICWKAPLRRAEVRVLSGRATQLLPIQLQELTLLPEAESFLQLILSHPYLLTYVHPQDRRKTLPLELCLSTQTHGPYSPAWITLYVAGAAIWLASTFTFRALLSYVNMQKKRYSQITWLILWE